ncbi:MAG: DUF3368 domain-containing protein [Chitinophagales bacterium]|nr:DUF3368 domain-containing protein [Chitinophagales bacterium]
MPKSIISDTSVLIVLERIGELNLLREVFGKVYITDEIKSEYRQAVPEWIIIVSVKNKSKIAELNNLMDLGEASAIALALELDDSYLIVDDIQARIIVKKLGIPFIGTAGVLLSAKKKGLIKIVKPYLQKLRSVGFRLSDTVIEDILEQSGER